MDQYYPNFSLAAPEISLAIAAMILLLIGVFRKENSIYLISGGSVCALILAALLVLSSPLDGSKTFSDMFIVDRFSGFIKLLILSASISVIFLSKRYLRVEFLERFEFHVLILLATLGMMMMVSSSDLISLYMGLELQSLSLYILATFRRESAISAESGLKYFVLGALASGIILYGSSLIYGYSGNTNFTAIADHLVNNDLDLGFLFGVAFLIAGLAFKISAVPFHMWTPDVYQGAPTPVTAFFSVAPKIAAFGIIIRVLYGPLSSITTDWSQILILLAVLSMFLGAFAAIAQTNIKRLLAYSSISHVGFALMGLSAGTIEGVEGVLIYLSIYLIMSLGAWSIVLSMRRDDEGLVENISDLVGMGKNNPMLALAMSIFMFSMAGIPPLAGFFAKFYVFFAAINSQLYLLALAGVISAVIGAFYYLRIVKIMYFDEPQQIFESAPIELRWVIGITAVMTLFFFILPSPLINQAHLAALSLVP